MPGVTGHILIVDDNVVNRMMLARALSDQGHTTVTAQDGHQALQLLREQSFDVVLLDVIMPEMDGYLTLSAIKDDPDLRHIPIIMISAVDEMDSVIRCIEMGATDYLPKPFNSALLQARLNASLSSKRLRDLELEYLEQVGYVADAAAAVESNQFSSDSLDQVASRIDALGRLARVFQRMALEVHTREQRLKHQIEQLRQDIEEQQLAAGETARNYIPMDRCQSLARGVPLPEQAHGAALLADISGFTPLTEALARELGLNRGAEELLRYLNRVFSALIDEVHRYGGSVINFSGDAITCWFDDDYFPAPDILASKRALACAMAMQRAMEPFASLTTSTGIQFSIAIKAVVAAGRARRFLVGDPSVQNIDVLAGGVLNDLALGEGEAKRGQVLVQDDLVAELSTFLVVQDWVTERASGKRFAVAVSLSQPVPDCPWPLVALEAINETQARSWLLPVVYERVRSGKSAYLAELRQAVALMLNFTGIDFESDPRAGSKLDRFTRWVQGVLSQYEGSIIQLTIGEKGSFFYLAFGAPVAHEDDAARAVAAALDLHSPPAELNFIQETQIGITLGQMRVGAYGSPDRRTYGVLGDKTNLASRLMQAANEGILCEQDIVDAAHNRFEFEVLSPISVKGKSEPVAVYRPLGKLLPVLRSDNLPPVLQLTLKVSSVIGDDFPDELLAGIYPVESDLPALNQHINQLVQLEFLQRINSAQGVIYRFRDRAEQEAIYNLLLFSQRRQLHRAIAEWMERSYASDLSPHLSSLARHWRGAEELVKAAYYLEKAGEQAQRNGNYKEAEHFFDESLKLETASKL